MSQGHKRSSGEASQRLVIWGSVLGKGTHQDHISWLIGNPWGGNLLWNIISRTQMSGRIKGLMDRWIARPRMVVGRREVKSHPG